MKIQYFVRYVYGEQTLYIVDGETKIAIATLTGKRTVNPHDLRALAQLGHEIEKVEDPATA